MVGVGVIMEDGSEEKSGRFWNWLSGVSAVPVGMPDDAVDVPWYANERMAGTRIDKSWEELSKQFEDVLEAWRINPYARRIVGLVSAYVVGEQIRLSSEDEEFNEFICDFFDHPKNRRLRIEQGSLCDDMTRSGELFPVLFMNGADGMSYVRWIPATNIDGIQWLRGDYESETMYHQKAERTNYWGIPGRNSSGETKPYTKFDACSCNRDGDERAEPCAICGGGDEGHDGIWWCGRWHPSADEVLDDGTFAPVCLHYAINRPLGAVRGEGDLVPMLPWLRRYTKWLDDRVRLNAAVRNFLYIVYAKAKRIQKLVEKYRRTPPSGSVIIAEDGSERWDQLVPNLHAADAEADGRAIRWMIAAAGPGTSLLDFGETEASNLATAKAMAEMRWRFLARRQAYFSWMLADIVTFAYNRAIRLGMLQGEERSISDVKVDAPDISPSDNEALSQAAVRMAAAMRQLASIQGSDEFRRKAAELVLKFAGESLDKDELDKFVEQVLVEYDGGGLGTGQVDGVDLAAGGAGGDKADPFRGYP